MSYRVYFGRLPETLSQDDFEKLLEEHGKAKNIEWKSGYAYVDYKHGSDASNTVKNLNGKEIGGNNILVELAQNGMGGYSIAGGFSARMKTPLPRPVRTPHRVRIENLSSRAKWMELKELLSLAGEVTFADTHKRKHGEGIVEFANRRCLTEAIKMFDKTSFFGKTIRIFDESPRSRSRSRSRSPRRQSSPGHRKRDKRSRSPNRKKSPSKRRPESRKNSSRSPSPQKRSRKYRRSKSRSASPSPRKRRSRTPTKSSKHAVKKSKKSKRDESRSRSPSRKKKDRRSEKHKKSNRNKKSDSSSGSDNDISPKKKTKTAKKKGNSSDSESGSSSSSKDSKSDN